MNEKTTKARKRYNSRFFLKRNLKLKYIDNIQVIRREHTGSGGYVYLEHDPIDGLEDYEEAKYTSDNVHFRIQNNYYSCLFWQQEKRIKFLEIFCNGYEDFPEDPQDYEILD